MNKPYIYEAENGKETKTDEAIILIPDIYGQTDYSKRTAEEFAQSFGRPVFLLDYFYISTGEANIWDENDREKVHAVMQNFDPEKFTAFLEEVISEIKEEYPSIKNFSVIGFCFGGRLAYIAGGSESISKVISFYGGGANTENYLFGQSPVEYLISKKGQNIKVTSFFGANDPSISGEDRETVKKKFKEAGVEYDHHEYSAGHAYFQEGRKNYDAEASLASWEVLKNIFK
jgi:carboxymethylenebutenolidase